MTIYMPASPGFINPRFGLETNTQKWQSPHTKAMQRAYLAGARWVLTATLPSMNREQMANWQSFLLQLEGSANKFYGYDPDGRVPRGNPSGTPLVKDAAQTGSSLTTDGWTASTLVLRIGDYFVVNGELKFVTSDVTSDGSGNATINFKPRLRSSPADNAPLTVRDAYCEMVLIDDNQALWQGRSNRTGFYDPITFSAVEVFS